MTTSRSEAQSIASLKKMLLSKRLVDTARGCWLWTGATMIKGYGITQYRGRQVLVHRLAMTLFREQDPGALFVCHHCDRPSCFRPEHLFIGTAQDNTDDMIAKGRMRHGPPLRGERGPSAIVTEADVLEMLARSRAGETRTSVARRYGLSVSAVSRIVLGKNWRHITSDQAVARSPRGPRSRS